jgi:glucan phosphoethanolaminetransferase (alkaline phosphatase superfamily)
MNQELKNALFTGIILGIVIGFVDSLARIISFTFEWFEIYQSFLSNIIVITAIFLIIFLIDILIKKVFVIKWSAKKIEAFYVLTGVILLILVYGEVFLSFIINGLLFPERWPLAIKIAKILLPLFLASLYAFIIYKGNHKIIGVAESNFSKKMHPILKNIIFFVIVLIAVGLFLDIYLVNKQISPQINNTIENPNIILITLDTVRPDHLSLYGYEDKTSPNLDSLAENSVVFENAYSPTSWTLPAHASLFTGKFPSNHNAVKRHQFLDDEHQTLAELLIENGYSTAGFVGSPFCR